MRELTGSTVEHTMAPFHCRTAEPAAPHAEAARPSTFCPRSSTPLPGPEGGGGYSRAVQGPKPVVCDLHPAILSVEGMGGVG